HTHRQTNTHTDTQRDTDTHTETKRDKKRQQQNTLHTPHHTRVDLCAHAVTLTHDHTQLLTHYAYVVTVCLLLLQTLQKLPKTQTNRMTNPHGSSPELTVGREVTSISTQNAPLDIQCLPWL